MFDMQQEALALNAPVAGRRPVIYRASLWALLKFRGQSLLTIAVEIP